MQLIDIDNLKRPPQGDELGKLLEQLKGLKAMNAALDSDGGLYLSTKDGHTFGVLLQAEIEVPRKRMRGKIQKRILEVVKEIRRQTEALV